MNTMEAIQARHSTRAFSDRQVGEEELKTILFAGGQAAVGCADFASLRLYVVQNAELLREIDLASAKGKPSHPLYNAPTLVVLAAKKGMLGQIELSNAGCVLQNVMVAAADLGVDSVYLWMAMFGINDTPALSEKLGFPEGYSCVGSVALGYAAKPFPKLKAGEQRIEVTYLR